MSAVISFRQLTFQTRWRLLQKITIQTRFHLASTNVESASGPDVRRRAKIFTVLLRKFSPPPSSEKEPLKVLLTAATNYIMLLAHIMCNTSSLFIY